MRDAFERIYATNQWTYGSGEGSLPPHNRVYARFLEDFIRTRGVRSVLDMGCGDWQFSRLIDWGGARYLGLDVVESVVQTNKERFERPGVEFRRYSGDPGDLPGADLLIAKDVVQHWSNASIQRWLPVIQNYRWALITNCVSPRRPFTRNTNIADGGFRPLDLRKAPFHLRAKKVLTFTNHRAGLARLMPPKFKKMTLLVENPDAPRADAGPPN